jgi:hypothetical protein
MSDRPWFSVERHRRNHEIQYLKQNKPGTDLQTCPRLVMIMRSVVYVRIHIYIIRSAGLIGINPAQRPYR